MVCSLWQRQPWHKQSYTLQYTESSPKAKTNDCSPRVPGGVCINRFNVQVQMLQPVRADSADHEAPDHMHVVSIHTINQPSRLATGSRIVIRLRTVFKLPPSGPHAGRPRNTNISDASSSHFSPGMELARSLLVMWPDEK